MYPPTNIVIYAGRFQPFHEGHLAAYKVLCQMFSDECVFIATSNKTGDTSPFDFRDKLTMMMSHNISGYKIIQTPNPYLISKTILSKWPDIDLTQHKAIVALGLKDMDDNNPRFSFEPTKDGKPKHFQPFTCLDKCESADKHAYIVCAPTFRFSVMGKPVESATEIRQLYSTLNEEDRKELIYSMYPSADLKFTYLLEHSFSKLS